MRLLLLSGSALAAIVAASAAGAAETIAYTYDARGRLVTVARTGTPAINNGVTTTYTMDKAENRTNKATTGSANAPPP